VPGNGEGSGVRRFPAPSTTTTRFTVATFLVLNRFFASANSSARARPIGTNRE
jgi:hypothetical protein